MSQQRSEETRIRILAAAEACFAQQGYEAAGVAEICTAAGVSKGAFYHHFASKQAVFLALLNRWLDRLDSGLQAVREQSTGPAEALVAMSGLVQTVFQDGSGRLPIFLDFWSGAVRDPLVWQESMLPFNHYLDFFAEMVRNGIVDGTIRPVDPQTAARAIIALAIGMILQGLILPDETDWPAATQQSIAMLFQGLSLPPKGEPK